MRILHTADWHLGRTLEGRDRLPEQAQFIDELVTIACDQAIDLVLVAGDVFDTVNPPAAAEELYYDALARLSNNGKRPIVIIAGNHDSPDRLSAPGPLALKHGIHLVGLPNETAMQPLCVAIPEIPYQAIVAALPYPSEARLNEVLTADVDDVALQLAYSQRVGHVFEQMSAGFRADAVCLAISHLFVAGGRESDSERPIQIGTASTVLPSALPANAQYVALGHLHRPQAVNAAPVPTRYSGSPLAYSFSEAGQTKSVVIVEAIPGQPATCNEIPLSTGKPLVRWQAAHGLSQVETWCAEGRDANAWVDLEIQLQAPLTGDQIRRLRALHRGFVNIRPIIGTELEIAVASEGRSRLPSDELFRRFYLQYEGMEPPQALTALFVELLSEQVATGHDGGDEA